MNNLDHIDLSEFKNGNIPKGTGIRWSNISCKLAINIIITGSLWANVVFVFFFNFF